MTTGSDTRQVTLQIGGMTCASCARRIEKRLNRMEGVTASVNYALEQAAIEAPTQLPDEELLAEVESAGYTASLPLSPTPRGAPRPKPARVSQATRLTGCASGL